MIDSHTHLDSCAPPDEELVAAAAAAGVRRILTVGMDGASARGALLAALGAEELDIDGAAFGAQSGGGAVGPLDPLFPKPQ